MNVKYSDDLKNPRTLEKLEIERRYWQIQRGIPWIVVTEKTVDLNLVNNIKWIHPFMVSDHLPPNISLTKVKEAAEFMLLPIITCNYPLRVITNNCDKEFAFQPGASLAIVRRLIAQRQWAVDMYLPIQPEKPLMILNFDLKGGGKL